MFCVSKDDAARHSMCVACMLTVLGIVAMLVAALPHVTIVVLVMDDPDTGTVIYKDNSYVL